MVGGLEVSNELMNEFANTTMNQCTEQKRRNLATCTYYILIENFHDLSSTLTILIEL